MNEMGEVKAGSGNTQLERPVMGPGLVWMAYVFGWIGVISVALGCDRKLYYVKQHLNQAFCCAIVTTVSGIAMLIFNTAAVSLRLRSFWTGGSAGATVCTIFAVLFGLCALYGFIMSVLGWIAALRGKYIALPLVSLLRLF